MPSISTYTPLESLLFFQSIAALGATASAFSSISESLTKNDFIRRDESYNNDRLSPKALKELYNSLLNEETSRQDGPNGVVDGQENTRKRKLSSPPRATAAEAAKDPKFWSALIDRLYAQYRDHAVAAIKSDEKEYDRLKQQLREGESVPSEPSRVQDTASVEKSTATATAKATDLAGAIEEPKDSKVSKSVQAAINSQLVNGAPQTTVTVPDSKPSKPVQPNGSQTTTTETNPAAQSQPDVSVVPSIETKTSNVNSTPKEADSVKPLPQQPGTSSGTATPGHKGSKPAQPIPKNLQSPSPVPPQQQVGMPPPSASPIRPGVNMPGPPNGAIHPGMPFSPNVPIYPHYAPPHGYPPQPWPQQIPQQTPHHQQHPLRASPYAQSPPIHQDFSGRTPIMARSPQPPNAQGQYPPYPYHPAQFNGMLPYLPQQGPMTPGAPYPLPPHLAPTVSTPVSNRSAAMTPRGRASLNIRSPWKNTPSTTKSEVPRPPSRDVSPIPERIPASIESPSSNVQPKTSSDSQTEQPSMRKPERPARRNRQGSASPSIADRSRSQSIISHVSDTRNDSARPRKQIKHETPSTPVPPLQSDSTDNDQQRNSARRTRGNTLTGTSQQPRIPKRKRGDSPDADEASETPRPSVAAGPVRPVVDRDKVYATRNFARICGPIMNDVTAHKHAGIFAKPLTERDAPGYRSLIYRPSDLKTIKSMIHAGTKAVNAALEEAASASTPAEGGTASPAVNTPTGGTSKNQAILLDKTADLVPPKAIVNSAQLEKELLRMFANAVMFNPMPKSERGFGPGVILTRGDAHSNDDTDDNDGGGASNVEFKGYSNEEDSGSIIRDTREMMANVEEAVRIWRDAEQGSISFGDEFGPSLIRSELGSGLTSTNGGDTAGDDSMMEQDDGDGDSGVTGTVRKKRRITET